MKKVLIGVVCVAALLVYTYVIFVISANYAVKNFEARIKNDAELRQQLEQRIEKIEHQRKRYYQ